jgi:hypothetical protein
MGEREREEGRGRAFVFLKAPLRNAYRRAPAGPTVSFSHEYEK